MTNPPENQRPTDLRDTRGSRQIFLCDASAEAGRLLNALQTKGYSVVDVPLGLLISRCRHELPEVIICDADAHEAETRLAELSSLELPDVKLVLFGHPEGALHRGAQLKKKSHLSFTRPLDLDAVLAEVMALCSPPRKRSHRPRVGKTGLMPRLVAAARKPYRSDAQFIDAFSLPPEREEPSDAAWPTDLPPPSRGPLISELPPVSESEYAKSVHRSTAPSLPQTDHPMLSQATADVLERGRRRLESYPKQSVRPARLSVGAQSVACDLRPELLAALEEPLDDAEYGFRADDDHPESTSPGTRTNALSGSTRELSGHDSAPPVSMPVRPVTSSGEPAFDQEEKTNPGGRPGTQPPPELEEADVRPELQGDAESAIDDLSDLLSSPWPGSPPDPETSGADERKDGDLNTTQPPRRQVSHDQPELDSLEPDADLSAPEFAAPSLPASLFNEVVEQSAGTSTERDLARPVVPVGRPARISPTARSPLLSSLLANAIRERVSGSVAQQDTGGVRRVLLTDGDISTVISAISNESLAHFLHARGDITRDLLLTLGGIPAFGRHAGAALIARGLLEQEDLWPVLRAHAEWVLGRALGSTATAVLEGKVPQRLLDEPAVFGGAAGTEIYLDALCRVVTPEQAFIALGGDDRVLGRGLHEALMGESALSPRQQQGIWEAVGQPLGPVLRRDPSLLPLLLGLTQLGVLTAGGGELNLESVEVQNRSNEIDEEAFISKLMARRALVDEGDYFAVLGIARSATAYEVDRARDELLHLYSEEKLTVRTLHLRDDLELLRATIEEAHLVLCDDARRSRYRRALEAMPS